MFKYMLLIIMAFSTSLTAIEEIPYTVIKKDGDIEWRQYDSHIVAEVVVENEFDDAGNDAFRILVDFIGGENVGSMEIEMTAPVNQIPENGQEIAMTAPVSQSAVGENRYLVQFAMPAKFTMETLPKPLDDRIKIREIPSHQRIAIVYKGSWSTERYREHEAKLLKYVQENDIATEGQPIWARYDSPFRLWFLRRNEILLKLTS
jgi:effector-binding domain-containing protein